MTDLYFIGGAPLCGKSEVARHLQASYSYERPLQYAGTDGLRRILWNNIPEKEEPAFFRMHYDHQSWDEAAWLKALREDPDYFVSRQHNGESPIVWQRGVVHYLNCNLDRGLDTLVEGVAILPQFLAEFQEPHRAIFIGNTAPALGEAYLENVLATAQALRDHWMHAWSREKIAAYLSNVVPAYSRRIRDLASAHGYRFFDLHDGDYREVQAEAARYLSAGPLVRPHRALHYKQHA